MEKAEILNGEAIFDYYKNLSWGSKEAFTMKIAEALEMTTFNVRRKITYRIWKNYELKFVAGIMNQK